MQLLSAVVDWSGGQAGSAPLPAQRGHPGLLAGARLARAVRVRRGDGLFGRHAGRGRAPAGHAVAGNRPAGRVRGGLQLLTFGVQAADVHDEGRYAEDDGRAQEYREEGGHEPAVVGTPSAQLTALLIGVRRNRPGMRLPWYLFTAGQVFYTIADAAWNVVDA